MKLEDRIEWIGKQGLGFNSEKSSEKVSPEERRK